MIYTAKTKMALKLCFEAHKNQTDQSGIPYVFHPFHIAEQMKDENTTIVALLHDVVEDTDYTIEDLRKMGFGDEVVEAISLLTHEEGVSYEDYLNKIKSNTLAKTVKIADIMHNSDKTRLDSDDPRIEYFEKKYKFAMAVLEEK